MKVAPKPDNEIERLAALSEAAILDTPPETAFDDLTKLAAQICGVPIALISLIDTHRQWFKSRVGLQATETSREMAFCAHAILEDEVFIVPDAHEDDRFFDNPLVKGAPNVRFYAGAQLTSNDGFNVGTLCVIDKQPRSLSPDQLEALRGLARQASAQIDLRRVNNRLKRINQALTLRARQVENAWAQLDDLLDNSSDLIQSVAPNGRFIYVNRSWSQAIGYSVDEAKRLSMFDIIAPEYIPHCHHLLAQLASGETMPPFELVVLTKNGERLLLQGHVTARIEEGKLIATRGMFRDVTSQRKNEERVRLYANVVEHVQIGLLVWEGNEADASSYRLTAKNGAADRMLAKLGMLSLNAGIADMPPLFLAANLPEIIAQVQHTHAATRIDDIQVEGLFISTLVFPLPGRFVGVALEDVSQRKIVERLKDEFVSTVSHELRTPLTSIRGSLSLMAGGIVGPLPDHATELVGIAQSNTERLMRLINDILDLDKMDAGKVDLRVGPIRTAKLVTLVLEQMSPLAAEAGVELVSELRGLDEIIADEDRIIQVLTNLLSNAIKFSPPNTRVQLDITTLPSGNVRFAVTDNGPGIADFDKITAIQSFSTARRQ
jgi:PAS domain S-box-containing protein